MTGMKRALLRGQANAYLRALDEEAGDGDSDTTSVDALATVLLARVVYPDLVACVVEAKGLDVSELDVAAFSELPDSLVDAWEAAVYELNPHWLPSASADEEEQAAKKGRPSSG